MDFKLKFSHFVIFQGSCFFKLILTFENHEVFLDVFRKLELNVPEVAESFSVNSEERQLICRRFLRSLVAKNQTLD